MLSVTSIGIVCYGAVVLTELAFGDYAPVGNASKFEVETTATDMRQVSQATDIKDGSQATIIPRSRALNPRKQ